MISRYVKFLLGTLGLFVVLAIGINGIVDPFRFYHDAWFKIGFSENQRFQNPGLARTQDYEIVLIGTSHTEPFITSSMGNALGGRALNLSMSGSLVSEQSLMLEQVLRQGKVRRVLWEINYPSFAFGDGVSDPTGFPFFLFQPGAETPFRYLVSFDTFLESLEALSGQRPGSLDELHRWDLGMTFGEAQVRAHWKFMSQRWNDDLRAFWGIFSINEEDIPDLVDRHIRRLVASYPDVQFDLLFLPATLLEYGNDFQVSADRLDRRLTLRREVARVTQAHGNADAWDFQNDPELVEDWQHYKDIDHFGQSAIEPILQSLTSGDHRRYPGEFAAATDLLANRIVEFMHRFCAEQADYCQDALLTELNAFEQRIKR